MKLEQTQRLSQTLLLTQAMRQSLNCLQLSAQELTEYVQEAALSKPLLNMQAPAYYEAELPSKIVSSAHENPELRGGDILCSVLDCTGVVPDISAILTQEKTFATTSMNNRANESCG